MIDAIDIDTTPIHEDCAQVGTPDYARRARLECEVMKRQLVRQFGEPPLGCSIHRITNPHDFGDYYSLEIRFRDDREECIDWAFKVEGNLPERWDEEALRELAEEDYSPDKIT